MSEQRPRRRDEPGDRFDEGGQGVDGAPRDMTAGLRASPGD
jgi:hypothetical protein